MRSTLKLPHIKLLESKTDRSISESRQSPSISILHSYLYNNQINQADRMLLKRLLENNEKIAEVIVMKRKSSVRQSPTRLLHRITQHQTPVITRTEQDSSSTSDLGQDILKSDSSSQISNEEFIDQELKPLRAKTIQKEINKIQVKLTQEMTESSFFRYIKQKDKLKDIAQNFKHRDSNNPIYFYCINDNLFPKRIELSKHLLDNKKLNLSKFRITNQYLPILQNLLKSDKCKEVRQIKLCNSNLKLSIFEQLLSSFPLILKDLTVENNELGKKGALILAKSIPDFKLQINKLNLSLKGLNIANNHICDIGAIALLDSLTNSQTILRLNISSNVITDSISSVLYNFILKNNSLEMLQINWNQLSSNSGYYISKALQSNRTIRILDLSYNRLGLKNQFIDEFCQTIQQTQCSLIHLDLSYNQLTEQQLKLFRQALQNNHTLFGLHIEGNKSQAYIDAYGFIQFLGNEQWLEVRTKKHQIDGTNFLTQDSYPIGNDCCWICQGWSEQKFQYIPESQNSKDQLFLHLDFLNYRPIPMTTSHEIKQQLLDTMKVKNSTLELTTGEIIYQLKMIVDTEKRISMTAIEEAYQNQNSSTKIETLSQELVKELDKFYYTTIQMCPPRQEIRFFYSNPLKEEYFIDPNIPNKCSPLDDIILQGKDPKYQILTFSDGTQIPFQKISKINYIQTKQQYIIDDKNNYKPIIKVLPRSSEKKYILRRYGNTLNRKKLHITTWQKEESCFRQFSEDSEYLLDQCFEFDWSCSKIQRFVKGDYEKMKVKEYLRNSYGLLKDIYKYYSSLGYEPPQFEYFCIQFPQSIKILSQLNFIDGEQLKVQDVEIDLTSTKNNVDPKYIYNPEKALIRYQFIEMLFRIANDKYIRNNQGKNFADAVYKIIKDIEFEFKHFTTLQEWRNSRLWNRECDHVLSFKQPYLKKLYDFITDITNRKWYFKLKWISIREFKEFCKQLQLKITEKQAIVIYNFSMSTQIDEGTSDRNIRMNYTEFLESLGRIAEKVSPAPIGENIEQWSETNRQILPLHVKLESLITYIYYQLNSKVKDYESHSELFTQFKIDQGIQYFDCVQQIKLKNKKGQVKEENYKNISNRLTLYNTLAYLNENKQPYLHPKYKIFLKQQPEKKGTTPLPQIISSIKKKNNIKQFDKSDY